MKTHKEAIFSIDTLDAKGNGVGTWHRPDLPPVKIVVPFAIPGDYICAIIRSKKRGVYQGQLKQILTSGPLRREPRCLHFAHCGGCRWQQMQYTDQLATKEATIKKFFAPFALSSNIFHSIVPSDPYWQYRNKMEYSFSEDKAGKKYLGLALDSSGGKILNLQECHLTRPWFIEAVDAVRLWWEETGLRAYHPFSNQGSLRTLTVREGMRTGDRLVMLTVSGNPNFALNQQQINLFKAYLRDAVETPTHEISLFVRIQQVARGQETQFYEIHVHGPEWVCERLNVSIEPGQSPRSLEFAISPSAFFQPNTDQAEKLYSLALAHAEIRAEEVVYDLYCGTGTLGICAATRAASVIGIELSPEAALDARTNAKNNRIDNFMIYTGDVGQVLGQLLKEGQAPSPDTVLVDPPRCGLTPKALEQLLQLKAKKIVYISCNPATQAENCKILVENGYSITALQPVDQFPHTAHIENIAVLKR